MNSSKKYNKKTLLMGTQIETTIISNASKIDIQNFLEEINNIFYKIVAQFTRFHESSELNILNRNSGIPYKVSKELFNLVELGIQLGHETNGIFDITIIDLLEAYGYDKNYDFSKLDNKKLKNEISELLEKRPNFRKIELYKANKTIKLEKNQRIDLGAIAKGYAIKVAKDFLLDNNIENFLINAGGDIYANGKNENGEFWKTILFAPEKHINSKSEILNSKQLPFLLLDNESLACSGSWARKVKDFHHLLNPNTGKPHDNKTVFVKAKDPVIADAFATICYLMDEISPELLMEYKVDIIQN